MKTIIGFIIGGLLGMVFFGLEWDQVVPLIIGLTIGHLMAKRQYK